jgi:ADP-ribosylglycohydrolase
MKDIINRQGDTDANAAIVGGLLGAAYGIKGILSSVIDKVMRSDIDRGIYTPKESLVSLITIAVESPTQLKVSWQD